eukprot:4988656-Prymnesium_polylepis.1
MPSSIASAIRRPFSSASSSAAERLFEKRLRCRSRNLSNPCRSGDVRRGILETRVRGAYSVRVRQNHGRTIAAGLLEQPHVKIVRCAVGEVICSAAQLAAAAGAQRGVREQRRGPRTGGSPRASEDDREGEH